jgi:nicotinate-nucleotide--dimethylbenzimidazole phosphoribosyltransferase
MGIGNSTAAAAIVAAAIGCSVSDAVGTGTGIDAAGRQRKIAAIEQALALHQPKAGDGLALLSAVGGFEIGALAGAMLAAAAARVPAVIDGYICTAAALVAARLCPAVREYLIAGHVSTEPGHPLALADLRLRPLLQLDMRLGEGSGAVLALHLLDAACRVAGEMATFDEAHVSRRQL